MKCSDVRERLSAYLDGELGEPSDTTGERAASAIDVHLANCADCRTELARLRATVQALQGVFEEVKAEAPPVPLHEATALALDRSRRRGPWRRLSWLAAAAALVLVWFGVRGPGGPSAAELVRTAAAKTLAAGRLSSCDPYGVCVDAVYEHASGRYAWTSEVKHAPNAGTWHGGFDGEHVWMYVPGEGVFLEETEGAAWLPDGVPGAFPDGLGPHALTFLEDLEAEDFVVESSSSSGDEWIVDVAPARGGNESAGARDFGWSEARVTVVRASAVGADVRIASADVELGLDLAALRFEPLAQGTSPEFGPEGRVP